MKSFVGKICSADSSTKTFEVYCEDGIKGVTMGQRVLVIPIGNENMTPWGHVDRYMKKYNPKTGEFDLELRDTY